MQQAEEVGEAWVAGRARAAGGLWGDRSLRA